MYSIAPLLMPTFALQLRMPLMVQAQVMGKFPVVEPTPPEPKEMYCELALFQA